MTYTHIYNVFAIYILKTTVLRLNCSLDYRFESSFNAIEKGKYDKNILKKLNVKHNQ